MFFMVLVLTANGWAADRFVNFEGRGLWLNEGGKVTIFVDGSADKGVQRAALDLCNDIHQVCGAECSLTSSREGARITVAVDPKMKAREKFIIRIDGQSVTITGSDKRGAIYGIYEISRQIGVSPWYYWADVPVARHDRIGLAQGEYTDGEPAVRYRGLFLNDEAPCLTSWVKNTFGTNYGGHDFYAKVFELILRMKGNFLWPAMWGWAFYADDPLNSKTADEMGVIIGTSHHEPMARNHQEWARHRRDSGA